MKRVFNIGLCGLFLAGAVQADEPLKPWLSIQPWWIPMCFFVDPAVNENKANGRIEKIVTEYAACGINVRPFVFTIKSNYENDLKALKQAALTACPLREEFGVRGAIHIESKFTAMPGQQCGQEAAQACSTQCLPMSISFVSPNASPEAALRESMRGNCCGPLCVGPGEGNGRRAGLGLELTTYTEEIPDITIMQTIANRAKYEITADGCHALRAGASSNAVIRWYQKKPMRYYQKPEIRTGFYNLKAGRSFFEKGKVVSAKVINKVAPKPMKNVVVENGVVNKLIGNVNPNEKKKPRFREPAAARIIKPPLANTGRGSTAGEKVKKDYSNINMKNFR